MLDLRAIGQAVRRTYRQSRFLSIVATACVAVGVAGAVFILTISNAVLFRQAPFPNADRLARVWVSDPSTRQHVDLSYPEVRELRAATSFDTFEFAARTRTALSWNGATERLRGESVSPGYFGLIGVRPALGRSFAADEFAGSGQPVMLISDALWRGTFAGDSGIIGRTVSMRGSTGRDSDRIFTIIGVLPPGFVGTVDPDESHFWLPIAQYAPQQLLERRTSRFIWALARLRPGVSATAAQGELSAIASTLTREHPEVYRERTLELEPVGESWRARFRDGLVLLGGVSILLLCVACANVAHLLLARFTRREHDLRLRLVLGAAPRTLLWHLLAESTIIASIGGAIGIGAALAALRLFRGLGVFQLPSYVQLAPDLAMLGAALLLVFVASVLGGVVPAWWGSRLSEAELLNESGRSGMRSRRQGRMTSMLVGAEVALSFVLLVGCALMLRSYANLARFDTGFRTRGILRLAVSLDASEFPTAESRLAFAERVKARLRTLPGARDVSVMSGTLPPWPNDLMSVEEPGSRGLSIATVSQNVVDERFLETLDIPLLLGRDIGARDGAGSERVAVVSRALARRLGDGDEQRALGRTIVLVEADGGASAARVEHRVVGVAADMLYGGPRNSTVSAMDVYTPLAQSTGSVLSVAVRADGNAAAEMPAYARALSQEAPTSPVHWVSTMEDEFAVQFRDARLYAWLTSVFGAAALLLVTFGIFGVIANGVSQRRREIGVRLAVGATAAQVVALMVRRASLPLAIGLACGTATAIALTGVARSLLFGLSPNDPMTFAAVAAVLAVSGMVASLVPALGAARVDPARVLRGDG